MLTPYFNNIESALISALEIASQKVVIAVAWFNNERLFASILRAARRDVQVILLIINDRMNNRPGGLAFQRLIDSGVIFHFSKGKRLMHNKFCIIDNNAVFTGSYNWTYAAETSNQENLIKIEDEKTASYYFEAFNTLLLSANSVFDIQDYLMQNPPSEIVAANDHLDLELVAAYECGIVPEEIYEESVRSQPLIYPQYAASLKEFCQRYPIILLRQLAKQYTWDAVTLVAYRNKVNFSQIQYATKTIWTAELIREFSKPLFKASHSLGTHFPGNEMIFLSLNELLEFPDLQKRYEELKSRYSQYSDINRNHNERFFIYKVFADLQPTPNPSNHSQATQDYINLSYVWTEDELIRRAPEIEFWTVLGYPEIEWTRETLLTVQSLKTWQFYIFCRQTFLTPEQLIAFHDILDWKGVAANATIKWTMKMFDIHRSKLVVNAEQFSLNTTFPWTPQFIIANEEWLNFKALSGNTGVVFTEHLILRYRNRWWFKGNYSFKSISGNTAVEWNAYLIDELKNDLHWIDVAENTSTKWTLELIEKYLPEHETEYFLTKLSYNPNIWKRLFESKITAEWLRSIAPQLPSDEHRTW
ncbi:hypothetical protein A0256_20705 [Mucilaginibacter sp. PAMC 26640]|nr:hypothetical protein A0256_20705 [Mucilaginibacter sp. PAMC 26640]